MKKDQPIVSGSSIVIPRNWHTGNRLEIPGCERRIFPTSDKRATQKSFKVDGVIFIINGRMDHTLSLFFKNQDFIAVKYYSSLSGESAGDRLVCSNLEGKVLLNVFLGALDMYAEPRSSCLAERLKKVVPGYSGRLMYDFENHVLRGAGSFGLMAALAAPFKEKQHNGHAVPDFIKDLIFTRP